VIAELRNVMSDDAREPQYIRTVHGFGYAFATKPRISTTAPAGTRGARLLVRGREMFLNAGENIVGRDPDTSIYIDDLSVSRKHVRIVVSDTDAILEDLGSKNGTLHNGAAVKEPVTLRDRDVVTLGSMTIVFRASSDAGPTMTIR
jgi:pSer/pThr/pTyr-binding forkhead associated (FHA) protein